MTIGPKIGKAIGWINGELLESPEVDIARKLALIAKASLQFDLSPKDEEYLHHLLKVNKTKNKTEK